ncbi:MAG: hypothetical protein FJX29_04220 [Alphaproteobacteria bacterium]|nr:hypothetical protein [Alphaproteobacteria bacterium]
MIYISLIAVLGIVLLFLSGAVPMSSVGGPLVIALAFFAAGFAVAFHEAWTKKRGILGWLVNIIVTFAGVFLAAPVAGMILEPMLARANPGQSLAAAGGPLMYIALASMMAAALAAAWCALWLVNRLRK